MADRSYKGNKEKKKPKKNGKKKQLPTPSWMIPTPDLPGTDRS